MELTFLHNIDIYINKRKIHQFVEVLPENLQINYNAEVLDCYVLPFDNGTESS